MVLDEIVWETVLEIEMARFTHRDSKQLDKGGTKQPDVETLCLELSGATGTDSWYSRVALLTLTAAKFTGNVKHKRLFHVR